MADYNLKSITPDTTPVDANMVFGADDQSSATPKPYTFAGIKSWIQGWISAADLSTGTLPVARLPVGLTHPGYKANVYYAGYPYIGVTAGGAPSVTATYLSMIYIGGNSSVTISSLICRVTTLGTSNIQLALYTNDTTVSPARPGTLVANTASFVNTSAGSLAGTFTGVSIAPGFYWVGLQVNDITCRFQVVSAASFAGSHLVGSTTLASFLNPVVFGGVSVAGTFGTWPASLNGSTWNETTSLVPSVGYLFSSVP